MNFSLSLGTAFLACEIHLLSVLFHLIISTVYMLFLSSQIFMFVSDITTSIAKIKTNVISDQ